MNPWLIPMAAMCGLVVASLGVSFFSLVRARALAEASEERARGARQEAESALAEIRRTVEALSGHVDEFANQPAPTTGPARPGLNLSKRSQALRMQRRGESAPQIASSLEIPLQEVELLLKVHHIVMSNI